MSNVMSDRITPIFVLGSARNGTTWLCNMLAQHPQIAAVQHQAHWGFHESNLYKNQRYWGSLEHSDRLVRCVELYGSGDHVRLAGGSKHELYAAQPGDFYELFFNLMDGYAERSGASFWMTKLDPLYYQHPRELARLVERLEERYPRVHFVAVQRDLPGVVQSYLNMEGRAGQHRTRGGIAQLMMLFETARYVVHYRRIRRLAHSRDIPILDYKALKDDPRAALETALRPMGLRFEEAMLEQRFQANSSLAYRGDHLRRLSRIERATLRFLLRPLLSALWPLAWILLRLRERSKQPVPPVYFKLLKLEHVPEMMRRELEANEEYGLRSVLFGRHAASTHGPEQDAGEKE
jgi:hypothetical protein